MPWLKDIEGRPVLLWVNYGSEGWAPSPFETVEDAIRSAQSGVSEEWIITRTVVLTEAK